MKRKSAAATSRSLRRNGGAVANMVIQQRLAHQFGHPFKVSGGKGKRNISWTFGPHPEKVWEMIVREFPVLAVEAMASAVKARGVDITDGYITMKLPSWLQRLDFFTAPFEVFPHLISIGGDPNESDEYGITPLEYAIGQSKSEEAIVLIEAGARFEPYGPDGWKRMMLDDMPGVIAAMEAVHLRQVTAMAFAEQRPPVRL